MIVIDRIAHFRGNGLGCLGSYRALRMAFGPIYLSMGWRIKDKAADIDSAMPPLAPQECTRDGRCGFDHETCNGWPRNLGSINTQ